MDEKNETVANLLEAIAEGDEDAKQRLLAHMANLANEQYQRGINEMRRAVLDAVCEK